MALTDTKQRSARPRSGRRTNRVLIELRLERGWAPNDLARVAGIAGNTVRAAERGEYVEPRSQHAMASALQVSLLVVFPFERQREAA